MEQRTIRSFVRRNGRITNSQQRAIETLNQFVLPIDKKLNLNEMFGRNTEKHLEIGFGMGDSLAEMAAKHPEHDYLGIEVYQAGVGHLLLQVEKLLLTNVRILSTDAVNVLKEQLQPQSIDVVYIFFPDPWHKKRHHKRRLIQKDFLDLLATILKKDGKLYIATDWENYAQHILEVVDQHSSFINQFGKGNFAHRNEERPLTKFEKRGQRLGHGVWDFNYLRVPNE
jgi:tRNA (guanine-N7-)-methyltransferase